MELQKIRSAELQVKISPLASELQSIQDSSGTEYIWQGDPKYWDRKAINLFPYIGRLTEGSYFYGGKRYSMKIHGFLPETEMTVESVSESAVRYFLRDSETTRKSYPFPFELRISYVLTGCLLNISYEVFNSGHERMFFGIGGHPGFCVPLECGLAFEDYFLEFEGKCRPILIGLSERCFLNGVDTEFPLNEGKILPLRHELFDNDAIVLRNVCRKVTLKSNKSAKSVTVSFPGMPYIGFWHKPKSKAPYVCVEPWTSLPSRDGIIEDITNQPGLIGLDPGERYVNSWSIEIHP